MVTFFCPNCWTSIPEETEICPHCGYELKQFGSLTYEDKLLAALHHSVPERRIMAAQILGNRGCEQALPIFLDILQSGESNYFLLRAILMAAIKINSPLRLEVLTQASHHDSLLVKKLASEMLTQLNNNQAPQKWDRNTG
ncbi:HEAT repeat domain-containing protein [Ornatilinea apprima]|nr:HEAT repeat domain-containing protein [Ornatilinea apprima]